MHAGGGVRPKRQSPPPVGPLPEVPRVLASFFSPFCQIIAGLLTFLSTTNLPEFEVGTSNVGLDVGARLYH